MNAPPSAAERAPGALKLKPSLAKFSALSCASAPVAPLARSAAPPPVRRSSPPPPIAPPPPAHVGRVDAADGAAEEAERAVRARDLGAGRVVAAADLVAVAPDRRVV